MEKKLRKRLAIKEQSLYFDLFKTLDLIESSHNSYFYSPFSLKRAQHVLSYHLIYHFITMTF